MRVEPHEGLIPLKKRPPRAPYSIQHSKKSPAMNQEESRKQSENWKKLSEPIFSDLLKFIKDLQHLGWEEVFIQ